jgi:glycerol-3-phosphate acyltransferase PlsY
MQWVPGTLSLAVKLLGREADPSPPSSAEVKNVWIYISNPQYVFMTWCLVKHRDNFTFYFINKQILSVLFLITVFGLLASHHHQNITHVLNGTHPT